MTSKADLIFRAIGVMRDESPMGAMLAKTLLDCMTDEGRYDHQGDSAMHDVRYNIKDIRRSLNRLTAELNGIDS